MTSIKWIRGKNFDYPEGYPSYMKPSFIFDLKIKREEGGDLSNVPKKLLHHRWLPTHLIFFNRQEDITMVVNPHEGEYVPARTLLWIKRNNKTLHSVAKKICGDKSFQIFGKMLEGKSNG